MPVKTATIGLALAATTVSATPAADPVASRLTRCLDDPAQASTGGQTECQTAAARAYDRRMNIAYTTLLKTLPPEAAQQLRSSQRAWLAFRDKEAAMRDALYATRQGTMFVPMQASAETTIVRDRALQLEDYVGVMSIE